MLAPFTSLRRKLFRATMRHCLHISHLLSLTSSKWCWRGILLRGPRSTSYSRSPYSSAALKDSSPALLLWTNSLILCSITRTCSSSSRKFRQTRGLQRSKKQRLTKKHDRQRSKWPTWTSTSRPKSSCSSTTIPASSTTSTRSIRPTLPRMRRRILRWHL